MSPSSKLAPIVLFVYNRPLHTQKTVEALKKNPLASSSDLFVYSDGARNKGSVGRVKEVRRYLKTIEGFKEVTVIEQEKNLGLSVSIIKGVTEIVNRYGKVIVIEADIVTSPAFLKFMNAALDFYQEKKKVWHISGWNYPISTEGLDDVFLWRLMNCWGWGTWADRWQHYEKDVDKVIADFTPDEIKRFNLDGASNHWKQIAANKTNKIDTWAIFWYATIFKRNGLCLNPSQTLVRNIGVDGSGVHMEISYNFDGEMNLRDDIEFITQYQENALALERIKDFHRNRNSYFKMLINLLSKVFVKTKNFLS